MRRFLAAAAWLLPLLAIAAPAPEIERGRFRIEIGGRRVGVEEFEVEPGLEEVRVRGRVELKADEEVRQTFELVLSPAYEPRRYQCDIERPKRAFVRVVFQGAAATVSYSGPAGAEEQQQFTFPGPRVALLDNNVFFPYQMLARYYDFAAGGPQPVQVFIPQSVQPGLATLEKVGEETLAAGDSSRRTRRLRLRTEDSEVMLWFDDAGRLWQLRAGDVTVLREP